MIIGLCGAIGSGKTTVAKHLVLYCDFQRMRFAGPLKAMARAFGLTEAQVDGDQKEVPVTYGTGPDAVTFTPRHFMQKLGTEFGRDQLGKQIWVELFKHNAEIALKMSPHRVVVDDVRFPNEVQAIKDMGGTVIYISRPGVVSSGHASEEQDLKWDFAISNDGSIQELTDKIEHALFVLS